MYEFFSTHFHTSLMQVSMVEYAKKGSEGSITVLEMVVLNDYGEIYSRIFRN